MIEYKITFVKTDLKEVTDEQAYNGAYQVFFKDVYWDIWGVDDTCYDLLEVDVVKRKYHNPMGIRVEKMEFTEIYKPVIELVNESDNQLLMLNDYVISKKPPVESTSNHLEYFINDYEVFNVSDLPNYIVTELPLFNDFTNCFYITTKELVSEEVKQWFFDRKIKNGEPVLIVHSDYTFTNDPLRTRKYSVVESSAIPEEVLEELSKSISPTPNLHVIDFYNGYLSCNGKAIKDPNFIITEWFLEQGRENEKILFIWDN